MPNNMVGRQFILWLTPRHPVDAAYHDQFGIARRGFPILEEIPVTVTGHKKDVHDQTVLDEVITTRMADGREFTALGTMSGWMWLGTIEQWVEDACKAYNGEVPYPYCSQSGEKVFPTGALKCEKHDKAYMADDPIGCFDCYLDKVTPTKPETATTGS